MSGLYNNDAMKVLAGGYLVGDHEALAEASYITIARTRRRQAGQMTVALDKGSVTKRMPKSEYFVSRKIDGEFTLLIYSDGEAVTLNPGGTLRAEAPFMKEAAEALKKAGIKKAVIGGELYVQRPDKKRARVHDVVRVARAPESADDVAQLAMGFFNIYDLDGTDVSMRAADVVKKLQEIFKGGKRAHAVETVKVDDTSAVVKQYQKWVEEEGEEGIVARSDATGMFKVKPLHSLDLAVVGFTESINEREGLLHDMLLAVVRDDGTFQIISRVGGGFSEDQRGEFLKKLKTMVVESDFREVNSDRVAYQMIRPELVCEIECIDLVSRTSRDNTIDRMVLTWNDKETRWEGLRSMPLCSILSPQFIRFRDDKKPIPQDVRMSQISDIVEIPDTNRAAEELTLPKSELIKRAVAVKEAKGAKMVRKVVLWKTNKQDVSRDFPAYVIHVTNYSANRKEPLEYDLRVTSSLSQAEEMFGKLKKELFVSGWKEA
jgi:ATP-dependent DNA ligase